MSDNKVLQGREISYRYYSFLEKKKDSADDMVKLAAQESCDIIGKCFEEDNYSGIQKYYVEFFSKYPTSNKEIQEIIYIIERIKQFYK